MLSRGRALWRLARAAVHVLGGLAIVLLRFPVLDDAARQRHVQRWSLGLLRAMGLRLSCSGQPRQGATLLVANHLSWLDIAALHAVVPQARFVSKAEVQGWPLLGRLVAGAGTLFIERARKRDAARVLHAMAQALQQGQTVAVFPEGTTGSGEALLPFHANLLQAAVVTGTPVQAVALRYHGAQGEPAQAVRFVGDTTLLHSLWQVACAQRLSVRVQLLEPLPSAQAERRQLALRLHDQLRTALQGIDAQAKSGKR